MTATLGAQILAAERYRIRVLTVRSSLLVAVQQGAKTLAGAQHSFKAQPHQGMLVAQGTQWDVINDPMGQAQYQALALSFSDELVQTCAQRYTAPDTREIDSALVFKLDNELLSAVQRTIPNPDRPALSAELLHHRCMEVLLLLAERGHRFPAPAELSWNDRVRRLVSQRPHAPWTVDALARSFHMSASTLQRRLADSGETLSAIVRDVRLEIALGMLQTTELPVGEVALRCGWESHSRFTAVFQERWGVAPSVIKARVRLGSM